MNLKTHHSTRMGLYANKKKFITYVSSQLFFYTHLSEEDQLARSVHHVYIFFYFAWSTTVLQAFFHVLKHKKKLCEQTGLRFCICACMILVTPNTFDYHLFFLCGSEWLSREKSRPLVTQLPDSLH